MTLESIKRRLRDALRIAKLIRRKVTLRISIPADEITEYLTVNRPKLEIGLPNRTRQIVITPDTVTEAGWEAARVRGKV